MVEKNMLLMNKQQGDSVDPKTPVALKGPGIRVIIMIGGGIDG